jgi:hypothetical protein
MARKGARRHFAPALAVDDDDDRAPRRLFVTAGV